MTVSDGEIEGTVEVKVGEDAPETEHIFCGAAHAGRDRNVVIRSLTGRTIKPEHLVVEVCDGNTGGSRIHEVGGIDAHASAGFAVGAESDAGVNSNFFEGAVAVVAIEL